MASALSTDLYELTMTAGYHAAGEQPTASFELFVRELPITRGYLVAAGLEAAVNYLQTWRFTPDQIAYLRSVPALQGATAGFFDEYLREVRFTGDVWAVPEGTPVFAGEPLLRLTAPLGEGQLVETALLSTILFQTSVASKAAGFAVVLRVFYVAFPMDIVSVEWSAIFAVLLPGTMNCAACWLASRGHLHDFTKLSRTQWFLLSIASIMLTANYVLYVIGLDFTTPASTQLFIQLGPLLLALGGIIVFRERFSLGQWVGLAMLAAVTL